MNYNLELMDRPFKAIKAGVKKIEGRTPKDKNDKRYAEMNAGDTITFTNNMTNEVMTVEILRAQHYSDVRLMLETEGIENALPGCHSPEEGVKIYDAISGYRERIKKFGIYGIEVRPIINI